MNSHGRVLGFHCTQMARAACAVIKHNNQLNTAACMPSVKSQASSAAGPWALVEILQNPSLGHIEVVSAAQWLQAGKIRNTS
jgi:hypothetical protein